MSPRGAPPRAAAADGRQVFATLRGLLLAQPGRWVLVHDIAGHVYVNCAPADARGKPQFFGAVKTSGRRQLFHFMPVYDFPELLAGTSPALRQRMQGKSCFNFESIEPALLAELEALVARGAARYRDAGKL